MDRLLHSKRERKAPNLDDDGDDRILKKAYAKALRLMAALPADNFLPIKTTKFDNVPEVRCKRPLRTTWNDTEPGKRTCYTLVKLNDDEIVKLGKMVFEELHSSPNIRSICTLLLLAYNLKDREGNPLFGDVPPELLSKKDIVFAEIKVGRVKPVSGLGSFVETKGARGEGRSERLAMGYSFLAGSYLRLFTKDVEPFVKTEGQLKRRFKSFYGFDLPFDNLHPNLDTVLLIKKEFITIPTLMNTLYNLLYAGRVVGGGMSIKDFLYGLHPEMTGLHETSKHRRFGNPKSSFQQRSVSTI